jgi:hypothetical protein
MKKFITIAAIIALGCATSFGAEIFKAAALSTAVTNTSSFTARSGYMTTPHLFVHTTTQTNTPVITVNPIKTGAPTYTVYTSAAKTNTTTTVVMNDKSDSTSPKVIMLGGDILTITGTAASWATAGYYLVIEETKLAQ